MFSELLPIGSVVLLKNAIKKLMITGIKPIQKADPPKTFDYVGVIYPEGYLGGDSNFLFNHEDINDVVFTGYVNPERDEFIALLEQTLEQKETDTVNGDDGDGQG